MTNLVVRPRSGWLFGVDPTTSERALATVAGLAGVGVVLWQARDLGWAWWAFIVAGLLAFDLIGGVIANALDSSKRFYHGPLPLRPTAVNRFLHHPVGFAAVHVQPIVAGLLFGGPWWWGPLWYAWALAGVAIVTVVGERLDRPVALFVVVLGMLAWIPLPDPAGLSWLPPILLLKLVLAHAVPEKAGPEKASPEKAGREKAGLAEAAS